LKREVPVDGVEVAPKYVDLTIRVFKCIRKLVFFKLYTLVVSANRVLRETNLPLRHEVAEKRITLHIEELDDLYSSPDITQVKKLRRMTYAWHVV
jgi:hypothetical protein